MWVSKVKFLSSILPRYLVVDVVWTSVLPRPCTFYQKISIPVMKNLPPDHMYLLLLIIMFQFVFRVV